MWRLSVLLVTTVLLNFATADVKPTDDLLVQRLKRSPPNACDNYGDYPPPRPRYWPPPPPPPPPPYWPPPPGPPLYWRRHHHRHRFEDFADAASDAASDAAAREEEPCSSCLGAKGDSSALSNAKSENGDAIAIAVAKASPKKT